MEAWRLKMEAWRVLKICITLMRSRIRIRIRFEVKRWIRIHIRLINLFEHRRNRTVTVTGPVRQRKYKNLRRETTL
jgi:hypothetical protein